MPKYIIKSSGDKELFSIKKFRRSLQKAGASKKLIDQLAKEVEKRTDLKTTQEIYRFALRRLGKQARPVAARYNLQNALIQLGPTGFPFEQFVAELFKYEKYKVQVGQIVDGFCVAHEIDVIAQKNNQHFMVECKFHNRPGLKSDIKVTLYVQARFEDLRKKWEQDPKHTLEFHQAWVVTNTKFTSQAIAYGTCAGMNLLSWSFPKKGSLAQRIDQSGMYPITCLTSLTMKQKKILIEKDFVLCRDVRKHTQHLRELGLSDYKVEQVIAEAEGVCSL